MTTANGSQQQPQQGAAWRLSEASWQTQSLLLPRLLTLMLSFLPAPNFVFAARWPSPSRQGETSDTAQPGAWREAQAERAQTSAGGKRFFFFIYFSFCLLNCFRSSERERLIAVFSREKQSPLPFARSLASPCRRGRNHSAPAADPTLLRTCWSVAWGLGTSCLFFLELA